MASPFLMLAQENNISDGLCLCLYSLTHKKYSHNLNLLPGMQCVGSCNGWLVFVDKEGNPFLHNPFSETTNNLPPKQTLETAEDSSKIVKVVLSSHVVVVMYNLGLHTKIAFCRHGDEKWRPLDDCKGKTYYDVVCCERTNTLLALGPGPSVESWDFNETIPKKTVIIQNSFPRTLQLAHETFPNDLYSSQWFRLDLDRREWVDVESLEGFALFVGGNQSAMVSAVENEELKRNAIYFTDDYWERVDEDYSYGGHDLGVYTIGDGSIEAILDSDHRRKIEPPPFWIVLPRVEI